MSTRDQIAITMLHGQAEHCVAKRMPVDEAVAGLREIMTRADLLARTAGIIAGSAYPDRPERGWAMDAARLLLRAGADPELLPQHIAEGRRNVSQGSRGLGVPYVWPDDLDQVLADILKV